MRNIFPILFLALVACLAAGCATYEAYMPPLNAGDEPVLLIKGTFGGQGSLTATTDGKSMTVTLVQKGLSDIAGGTVTDIVGEAATVFGGGQQAPHEITIIMPTVPGKSDEPEVRHVVTDK